MLGRNLFVILSLALLTQGFHLYTTVSWEMTLHNPQS